MNEREEIDSDNNTDGKNLPDEEIARRQAAAVTQLKAAESEALQAPLATNTILNMEVDQTSSTSKPYPPSNYPSPPAPTDFTPDRATRNKQRKAEKELREKKATQDYQKGRAIPIPEEFHTYRLFIKVHSHLSPLESSAQPEVSSVVQNIMRIWSKLDNTVGLAVMKGPYKGMMFPPGMYPENTFQASNTVHQGNKRFSATHKALTITLDVSGEKQFHEANLYREIIKEELRQHKLILTNINSNTLKEVQAGILLFCSSNNRMWRQQVETELRQLCEIPSDVPVDIREQEHFYSDNPQDRKSKLKTTILTVFTDSKTQVLVRKLINDNFDKNKHIRTSIPVNAEFIPTRPNKMVEESTHLTLIRNHNHYISTMRHLVLRGITLKQAQTDYSPNTQESDMDTSESADNAGMPKTILDLLRLSLMDVNNVPTNSDPRLSRYYHSITTNKNNEIVIIYNPTHIKEINEGIKNLNRRISQYVGDIELDNIIPDYSGISIKRFTPKGISAEEFSEYKEKETEQKEKFQALASSFPALPTVTSIPSRWSVRPNVLWSSVAASKKHKSTTNHPGTTPPPTKLHASSNVSISDTTVRTSNTTNRKKMQKTDNTNTQHNRNTGRGGRSTATLRIGGRNAGRGGPGRGGQGRRQTLATVPEEEKEPDGPPTTTNPLPNTTPTQSQSPASLATTLIQLVRTDPTVKSCVSELINHQVQAAIPSVTAVTPQQSNDLTTRLDKLETSLATYNNDNITGEVQENPTLLARLEHLESAATLSRHQIDMLQNRVSDLQSEFSATIKELLSQNKKDNEERKLQQETLYAKIAEIGKSPHKPSQHQSNSPKEHTANATAVKTLQTQQTQSDRRTTSLERTVEKLSQDIKTLVQRIDTTNNKITMQTAYMETNMKINTENQTTLFTSIGRLNAQFGEDTEYDLIPYAYNPATLDTANRRLREIDDANLINDTIPSPTSDWKDKRAKSQAKK